MKTSFLLNFFLPIISIILHIIYNLVFLIFFYLNLHILSDQNLFFENQIRFFNPAILIKINHYLN